jgi:hypothetical protein
MPHHGLEYSNAYGVLRHGRASEESGKGGERDGDDERAFFSIFFDLVRTNDTHRTREYPLWCLFDAS